MITNDRQPQEYMSVNSDILGHPFDDFLSESEPLIKNIDELPYEIVSELYSVYDKLSKTASQNIKSINPAIRVTLCDTLDKMLDRIIDAPLDGLSNSEIPNKPKGVFAPSLAPTIEIGKPLLFNAHILKGIGLSAYLLAKLFNARPTMLFGTKPEDYPFASALPDLEILYLDTEAVEAEDRKRNIFSYGSFNYDNLAGESENTYIESYYNHLYDNYSRMDTLIFYGMYPSTLNYLDTYRSLRPDGKVYCALDMSSHWMKMIPWESESVRKFGEQCNVIATSCRYLRDELNRNTKVNFCCRWFPNAFYNSTGEKVIADAGYKENIILYVGRVGTKQKRNEDLLLAFARVSEILRNWSLRFVGAIEPDFNDFINKYFSSRPDLRNRVVFTGAIYDKSELNTEYAKAKIFVLSSVFEAFPNAYCEALAHGCKFVTSRVDPADDITNYGELGIKYPIGDIGALSEALLKTCEESEKDDFNKHISKALAYSDKYFNWNRNIKKLKYMLYRS